MGVSGLRVSSLLEKLTVGAFGLRASELGVAGSVQLLSEGVKGLGVEHYST